MISFLSNLESEGNYFKTNYLMFHRQTSKTRARLEILPNQVLTHAARAAAKQAPLVAARDAREGLWLEQARNDRTATPRYVASRRARAVRA